MKCIFASGNTAKTNFASNESEFLKALLHISYLCSK